MNASGEQGIRLDWPKVKPSRKAFLQRGMGLLAVLAIISVGGGWLWWTWGIVTSSTAMVDGRTYTITPRMTDTVTQVLVSQGQNVVAGQPLLRLNGLSYQKELAEARQQVQAVRPPSIEETAERVARAQAAETSMVQRIALARGEESNRRRIIEDSVAAHVKAQLAMRSMDAQGLQNQSAYAKAVQVEATARTRMESARAAAEEASRIRTAVEGELQRIRREIEVYRAQAGAYAAQGQGAKRGGDSSAMSSMSVDSADDMSVLTAPVAGRVALVQAAPGQRVERGQAVVQLVPSRPSNTSTGTDGGSAAAEEDLWILALFPEKDIVNIRPGQSCSIRLEAYAGQDLQGEVEAIVPATAAIMSLLQPAGNQALDAAAGQGDLISVRIKLLPLRDTTFPDMFLGMKTKVRIQTRSVPPFLARWL